MKIATLDYLNHHIRIELPHPEDSNTIYVAIYRQAGTFNPDEYNSYLCDYQFSAESDDPSEWAVEGVKDAIAALAIRGVRFHSPKPVPVAPAAPVAGTDDAEIDEIPF